MDWKKISIERLKDYNARKQSLDSITEQIHTLESDIVAIRAARTDGIPIQGGNGNRREEMLINNIAMREELQNNYEIAEREIEITEKGLNALTEEQKRVLYKFFIARSPGHVEALCDELCMEKSRVYAIKDIALKKFAVACYGVVEI